MPCVFCQIIAGEAPATDWRAHGLDVVSFTPLNPVTPGHRLFVPVEHTHDAATNPILAGCAFEAAALWGQIEGEQFNLITNNGPDATQSVYHLHVHYVPREANDGLALPWYSGKTSKARGGHRAAA